MNFTDLEFDFFRVDGQGVNENSRGVRITHRPTGIIVTRTEKIYPENLEDALKQMETLLKESTEG